MGVKGAYAVFVFFTSVFKQDNTYFHFKWIDTRHGYNDGNNTGNKKNNLYSIFYLDNLKGVRQTLSIDKDVESAPKPSRESPDTMTRPSALCIAN